MSQKITSTAINYELTLRIVVEKCWKLLLYYHYLSGRSWAWSKLTSTKTKTEKLSWLWSILRRLIRPTFRSASTPCWSVWDRPESLGCLSLPSYGSASGSSSNWPHQTTSGTASTSPFLKWFTSQRSILPTSPTTKSCEDSHQNMPSSNPSE